MIFRFILYGLLGLAIEVIWTALYEKVFERKEGWALQGTTYVWMFFIYGLTVLLYEPAHWVLDYFEMVWWGRGLVYSLGIMTVEYGCGWLLKKMDRCPWDYTGATPLQLHGLVRFDYAPLWFCLGMTLEPISDFLIKITPMIYGAI